jgi:hypothetical protein
MLLGLSHIFFNRFFRWEQELVAVSLLTRQVFFVHNFFIGLTVMLGGAASFFCANALLRPDTLSRAVLSGMATFWLCRLLAQFVGYDSAIWRGDRFSYLHARSVFLAVVLRYSDLWDRVLNRRDLIFCQAAIRCLTIVSALVPMAHMKPNSSRATAVVILLLSLPAAASLM